MAGTTREKERKRKRKRKREEEEEEDCGRGCGRAGRFVAIGEINGAVTRRMH